MQNNKLLEAVKVGSLVVMAVMFVIAVWALNSYAKTLNFCDLYRLSPAREVPAMCFEYFLTQPTTTHKSTTDVYAWVYNGNEGGSGNVPPIMGTSCTYTDSTNCETWGWAMMKDYCIAGPATTTLICDNRECDDHTECTHDTHI